MLTASPRKHHFRVRRKDQKLDSREPSAGLAAGREWGLGQGGGEMLTALRFLGSGFCKIK